MSQSLIAHLQHGLIRIATVSPRVLVSPPTQPRRASVALIVRVRPAPEDEAWLRSKWRDGAAHEEDAYLFPSLMQQDANGTMTVEARLRQFFALPWVQRGTPELMYIKRAVRDSDHWSSHIAFPGGRRDEEDENGLYTAMRETWEEVGIDLAENKFLQVGHLEDREITSSLGKRLLMILSPYVFVQLSPFSPVPNLQPTEVSALFWVPMPLLFTPRPQWNTIHIDVARHAPSTSLIRTLLRVLIGKMSFRCIELPNRPTAVADSPGDELLELLPPAAPECKDDLTRYITSSEQDYLSECAPHLQLWGLTLGMTLDFMAHMSTLQLKYYGEPDALDSVKRVLSYTPSAWLLGAPQVSPLTRMSPSVTEVFPRFSYPDVNFWIWVFGWRYRAIQRDWERSIGTDKERRTHWSGLALAAF